jgi:hypothetical protein
VHSAGATLPTFGTYLKQKHDSEQTTVYITKTNNTSILQGHCHETLPLFFFIKERLLIPVDSLRKYLKCYEIFPEFLYSQMTPGVFTLGGQLESLYFINIWQNSGPFLSVSIGSTVLGKVV